jgi:hypothetical protein
MTNNCYSDKRIDYGVDGLASDRICMHDNTVAQKIDASFLFANTINEVHSGDAFVKGEVQGG